MGAEWHGCTCYPTGRQDSRNSTIDNIVEALDTPSEMSRVFRLMVKGLDERYAYTFRPPITMLRSDPRQSDLTEDLLRVTTVS